MPAKEILLTVANEGMPSMVAQCNDGHAFWEGTRTDDPEIVKADMLIHDLQAHPEEARI